MFTVTLTLVVVSTAFTLAVCRAAGRVSRFEEEQEMNYLRSRR